jgi:isopenicillin-N epimerase
MKLHPSVDVANESDWQTFLHEFNVRTDSVYLNHGSFGIALNCVRYKRNYFTQRLDEQPMDFFIRQLEPLIADAKQTLAEFVGTESGNLIFVDNATYGMNVVANSIQLEPGDEILITDHTYGAVGRIWERACQRHGATLVIVKLPEKFESQQQIVDCIVSGVTTQTKLAVVSHITSATALIMPLPEICDSLSQRGVMICVDGPHAPLQVEFSINGLNCDFYCASCHKWLCAPLGSGFLYVNPKHHETIVPPIQSWGRLKPAVVEKWHEEFVWKGTKDPAVFLAIPTAINYFRDLGFETARRRMHYLAEQTELKLLEMWGTEPIAKRSEGWYGSMAQVPLPAGDWSKLQRQLWEESSIEVPVWNFNERWFIRVSCHLYNSMTQIETLCNSLSRLTI